MCVCVRLHASCDCRIKMCTEVSESYLETIHHEMGHVEYFMAYSHLPPLYRDGANCAFHEAIGDTIALSVMSRTHQRVLGLDTTQPGADDYSEYLPPARQSTFLLLPEHCCCCSI